MTQNCDKVTHHLSGRGVEILIKSLGLPRVAAKGFKDCVSLPNESPEGSPSFLSTSESPALSFSHGMIQENRCRAQANGSESHVNGARDLSAAPGLGSRNRLPLAFDINRLLVTHQFAGYEVRVCG